MIFSQAAPMLMLFLALLAYVADAIDPIFPLFFWFTLRWLLHFLGRRELSAL